MPEDVLIEDPLLINPEANWGQQPYAEPVPEAVETAVPQIQPPIQQPLPSAPPQPPANPRDQYVAMQLRLADMIRQRNEEQGGPGALQQPSEEEVALKSELGQMGNQPQVQPVAQPPVFRRPPSQVDFAEQNLRQAEEQKNRAVRNALSQIKVRNVAEAQKALAYYKQEQAGNRWKTIYGTQIAHGVPPDEAARVAWRDVSPLVFQGYGPAGLTAAGKLATPPPGNPRVMQIPGAAPGAIALIDAQGRPHFPPASLLQTLTPGTPIEAKSADGTLLGHYFQLQNNRWHFEPIKKVDTSKMPKIDALRWQDASDEIRAAQVDLRQQRQVEPGEESPQERIKKAHAVQKELTEKYGAVSTPAVKPAPQAATTPRPAPSNAPSGIPPTIMTKQEFDALDSGTIYIGKDGKRYRKP